ncbi:MAG: hydroxyacid dehydrogenase, partial [Treponema sp.]|nr:hydroxyacid dehydrogenase [Treponema sp.]
VHNVSVYTGWDSGAVEAGFDEPGPLFFVLTNSRGLTAEETRALHTEAGRAIVRAAGKKGRDFIVISRSDSTLRGHYPLETLTLKETMEAEGAPPFDGEIICPFLIEGGRYTAGNIHYVKTGDTLVPAARTEFAEDKTFGYRHSDLAEWVEEKTGGAFPASGVRSVSIEDLRSGGTERAAAVLEGVEGFGKVIVNALDYDDIKVFCAALYQVLDRGKRFMIRSAAAVPKVLGGVSGRPLLSRDDLVDRGNPRGGLIVIGSHVRKTTRQLECLLQKKNIVPVEFNTHLAADEEGFGREIRRVQTLCNESVEAGKTTVVFTSRKRFDLNTGNREDELRVSMKIAAAVTSFVSSLPGKPRFIVAKGGITSSEIGTAALGVKRALVLGQVLPGVPVWLTGSESRFPGTPYIIFPGNVGEDDSLKRIADLLEQEET